MHVGMDYDTRSTCTSNAQGVLLSEVVDCCGLHIASLGVGSTYTYSSGDVRTTVDYAMVNPTASTLYSLLLLCVW